MANRLKLFYFVYKSILKSIKFQFILLIIIFLSVLVVVYTLLYVKKNILSLLSPKFALLPSELYTGLDKGDINFYIKKQKIYYKNNNNDFSQNVLIVAVEPKKNISYKIKNLPEGCFVKDLDFDIYGIYFNLNLDCAILQDKYTITINNNKFECENFGDALFCQICEKGTLYEILNWFYPYIKRDKIYYSDSYLFDDIEGVCSNYSDFLFKYGKIITAISKVFNLENYVLVSETLSSNFMLSKELKISSISLKFNQSEDYKDFLITGVFELPPLKDTNINTKLLVLNVRNLQLDNSWHKYSASYQKNKIFKNQYVDKTYMFLYNHTNHIIYTVISLICIIFIVLINSFIKRNITKNLYTTFEILNLFSIVKRIKIPIINLVILLSAFLISSLLFFVYSAYFYESIYQLSKRFYYFILPDELSKYYSVAIIFIILTFIYLKDTIGDKKDENSS